MFQTLLPFFQLPCPFILNIVIFGIYDNLKYQLSPLNTVRTLQNRKEKKINFTNKILSWPTGIYFTHYPNGTGND
jgi:hypothetical protein